MKVQVPPSCSLTCSWTHGSTVDSMSSLTLFPNTRPGAHSVKCTTRYPEFTLHENALIHFKVTLCLQKALWSSALILSVEQGRKQLSQIPLLVPLPMLFSILNPLKQICEGFGGWRGREGIHESFLFPGCIVRSLPGIKKPSICGGSQNWRGWQVELHAFTM